MKQYKKGMFVDIVANGSIHKGISHIFYHGRTGRVFDISPNSIGVIVNKRFHNSIYIYTNLFYKNNYYF